MLVVFFMCGWDGWVGVMGCVCGCGGVCVLNEC